jgi:hypothetical protein
MNPVKTPSLKAFTKELPKTSEFFTCCGQPFRLAWTQVIPCATSMKNYTWTVSKLPIPLSAGRWQHSGKAHRQRLTADQK